MKYIFLINEFTIIKKKNLICLRIKNYCEKNNLDYIFEYINKDNEVEDALKKYQKTRNIIIAVGGDGTINRVLNCIYTTNNILGFIPYGTGNDFYKTIKEEYKNGITPTDVIKINNKLYINSGCFGIDADVANSKNIIKSKLIPKKLKYIVSLIIAVIKYKNRHLKISYEGKEENNNFATVAVMNGKYYGGGFKVSPKSKVNDGLINVLVAGNINKIKTIGLILKMKSDSHINSKFIKYFTCKNITVESNKGVKCNIDGEELTNTLFKIEVLDKKIELYYNSDLINEVLGNI